jgi:DNA polymerase III alpha subunit
MPATSIHEQDLIELLYQDKAGALTVDHLTLDSYLQGCAELGQPPVFKIEELPGTVEEAVGKWYMPEQYQSIDLDLYFAQRVSSLEEAERVALELSLFRERNMEQLLKFMIYLVDIMRENKIVWGVGRGSSVSSFLLFLVGLHSVNPIKYELDIREFIR